MRDALQAGDSKATPRLCKHVIDLAPIYHTASRWSSLLEAIWLHSRRGHHLNEIYHTHLLAATSHNE